ncbi:acyl-CoA synthetase [Gordonia sp. L191]|uniref:acyl-CoA synthetase n=1 Tax=Gordonia sp. L191 TaxID=2982699 RepID=UPI0024BF6BD7|nr:acyl-CoA synthetase [Gordonia sp. L191]WHU47629.1 acyl-CoA synthetase [Gordonia sp. L191]
MYPGAHLDTPDKPAVIMADTGVVTTFAQLESQSVRIARTLRTRGVRAGAHVAVLATNTARVFDIYWAAMRSGVYLTMVNWHLTPGDIAYIVNDCGASTLIVDAALGDVATTLVPSIPEVGVRLSFGGTVNGYDDLDAAAARESDTPPDDQPRGADMLYSSGTTGRPKGIKPALPARQIRDAGDTMIEMNRTIWHVSAETVYLSPAPLYHAAPLRTCAAVQALGGTVVVMSRFDAQKALEYIERHRVTYSQWVPTVFVRMLTLPAAVRDRYDVSSLAVAVHAAAPCPVEVKHQMIDWWGPILSEYYSSTELNGLTLVDTPQRLAKPGTVGTPVLGVAHICDESGAELPPGTIGTIYFERDELPFEYHNDPEKTRAAIHPDHPTWTTTGDVGYLDDDGYLFLTDRGTFLIISGGVNIYPQEIENATITHPDVLDAAVIGEPDPDLGEAVVAVIQPVTPVDEIDTEQLAEAITDHLRTQVAGFKLPRRIEFTDRLPRTPTGKLVKRELAHQRPDR